MSVTQHTVAIQQVRHILQGVLHQGHDARPLLLRAGIPPSLLDAPLARVSQAQYALLIRVLRRTLRDELWGLCSRPLPVGSFGECAAMLVRCRSLEEALRLGFSEASTFHRAFKKWTGVAPGEYRLTRIAVNPVNPVNPAVATADLPQPASGAS